MLTFLIALKIYTVIRIKSKARREMLVSGPLRVPAENISACERVKKNH